MKIPLIIELFVDDKIESAPDYCQYYIEQSIVRLWSFPAAFRKQCRKKGTLFIRCPINSAIVDINLILNGKPRSQSRNFITLSFCKTCVMRFLLTTPADYFPKMKFIEQKESKDLDIVDFIMDS